MRLLVREFLADAEKELRGQFARNFTEIPLVHERTDFCVAHALFAFTGMSAFCAVANGGLMKMIHLIFGS